MGTLNRLVMLISILEERIQQHAKLDSGS